MELSDIIAGLETQRRGNMNPEVVEICFDSRKVKAGCCFVAEDGTQADGHK